jgi:hypothetical protein
MRAKRLLEKTTTLAATALDAAGKRGMAGLVAAAVAIKQEEHHNNGSASTKTASSGSSSGAAVQHSPVATVSTAVARDTNPPQLL